MKSLDKKILIIIPAYNEEGNIAQTLKEVFAVDLPLTVVVVDDGSMDDTAKIAKQSRAIVLSLPFNLGIGGAVQTGYKYAREYGYDIAVQLDADGQHDANYLEKLIRPVAEGKADMTIGSRFIEAWGYQSSFMRRLGINFFSWLISFLSDYRVTDPTSGFRACNKKIIDVFARYYPEDFPEPEAIVVAGRYGAKILEVPVSMRPRLTGFSSIRYMKTLYYMIKVTLAILLNKIKHKPVLE